MAPSNRPLDLVCDCETTCEREDGSYQVLRVRRGSKCHEVGQTIPAEEVARARYANAEWDRAEREWLEQP
jgi:hypothetical protein